jgi:hypothetical protein
VELADMPQRCRSVATKRPTVTNGPPETTARTRIHSRCCNPHANSTAVAQKLAPMKIALIGSAIVHPSRSPCVWRAA